MHKTTILKYHSSGISKECLTDKKNIWFGPLHLVAQAVIQIIYPDFQVDSKKVYNIWIKHKCPGLIRRDTHSKYAFYLNGKKFKKFVLRNTFNMKKSQADLNRMRRESEVDFQEIYKSKQ